MVAPTTMLMDPQNSKEHSIVCLLLKAKVKKMQKRGTDFKLTILLVDCGGSREDCLLYLVSSKGINSKYI